MTDWIDFKHVKAGATFAPILKHYSIQPPRGSADDRKILCPFHKERKPSCSIRFVKGEAWYKCFGCGAEGSVIDFVMDMDNVDQRTAATTVAEVCEIALAPPRGERNRPGNRARTRQQRPKSPRPTQPTQAEDTPATAAESVPRPSNDNDGEETVNPPLTRKLAALNQRHPYLRKRGFSPETITEFNLGFSERGMMAGRICVDIHNPQGELIARAGRWASDDIPEDEEKFLLPSGFKKSQALFNLHRCVEMGAEHVVVVEGFFDAIALQELEVPAVALMGTSISLTQAALLVAAGITHATVAMDGDQAGVMATEQVVALLAPSLFVRAVVLPEGEDPESLGDGILELVEAQP